MRKKSTGFTLIEMLVGIVIGMIVVAAASVMMVSVQKSQKDVTASARLNQELGAAMAVMSNEIRRAGFSVCDINDTNFECPKIDDEEVPFIVYNTSTTDRDLEIFDVDGTDPPVKGDCILYRYNANLDNIDNPQELRGIRLKSNIIQMADPSGVNGCDLSSTKWVDITNPDVINVTGLSFSTTGSKCRNMTLPDPDPSKPDVIAQHWVVKDKTATGSACERGTTLVDFYLVTEDPSDPSETVTTLSAGITVPFTGINVATIPVELKEGHEIFGTRQIRITLDATLTRDPAVTKRLESSIKVANPRVHCWPDDTVTECQ